MILNSQALGLGFFFRGVGGEELYFNLLQICESAAKRNKKGVIKKDEKFLVQNKSLPVALSMAKAIQSRQMPLLEHPPPPAGPHSPPGWEAQTAQRKGGWYRRNLTEGRPSPVLDENPSAA